MSKRSKQQSSRRGGKASPQEYLRAIPHANRAMRLDRRSNGTALASVPMRKPKFLIGPLRWILPYSSHRRVELDIVGAGVLDLCDGIRNVETIIEKFAAKHKLTFRESQLAVGKFLRQLAQRGVIAIVGTQEGISIADEKR